MKLIPRIAASGHSLPIADAGAFQVFDIKPIVAREYHPSDVREAVAGAGGSSDIPAPTPRAAIALIGAS